MVYVFDDGGVLVDMIPERNTIEDAEHETLVAPASGLYEPITFNKETQTWSGLSEDEWRKEHPDNAVPSGVQKVVTALINQMGDMNEKFNSIGGN